MSAAVPTLRPGRYRHYKGHDYAVFRVARHSETEEPLVVYRTLYGERGWWVRPYGMFTETIEVDGEMRPRFQYTGPLEAGDLLDAD
ncbi:MAG: hypothetical protein K0S46_2293 [Moraxellaceae bacterium]|nr:hypothetical protein [Moraxellaceae bacterium]